MMFILLKSVLSDANTDIPFLFCVYIYLIILSYRCAYMCRGAYVEVGENLQELVLFFHHLKYGAQI